MKKTSIPFFKKKSDLFKFLNEHQEILMAEKKYFPKHGDAAPYMQVLEGKDAACKANVPVDATNLSSIQVRAVINTTNIMDSHGDVHIPGLWDKSLKENKRIKHLQEHRMEFDKIIAENKDLKAYTKTMGWLELGFNFTGTTEALIFESNVRKDVNEYMFGLYAKARVDSHSVGMQYVKLVMCINDEDYGAEFEAWQKYIPAVVNKKAAEDRGYFWAVTEAKVVEGSAVPIGSNYATPTLDNNMKSEPGNHSEDQPQKRTGLNYDYLLENFK